jgi:hypothetical protein
MQQQLVLGGGLRLGAPPKRRNIPGGSWTFSAIALRAASA